MAAIKKHEIALNQKQLKEILHYCPDTGVLTWKVSHSPRALVGAVAGCDNGYGYLSVRINGHLYLAHRLIMLYVNGVWPEEVDHISGVRDDNRWLNLRDIKREENVKNQKIRVDNNSGIVGICWSEERERWRATIGVNGKSVHLGRFKNFDDAVKARAAANIKYGFHKGHGKILS